MITADNALKKVCRQEVIVTSTFACATTGHNIHYYGIEKIMCIVHECMFWKWDTDISGHCKREAPDDQR